MDLPDEGQQRLSVGRPESRKLVDRRKLTAGNFQRQLQTLSPHVVIVLHPAYNQNQRDDPLATLSRSHDQQETLSGPHTWQGVPLVSVGDAVQERPAVSAAVSPVHGGVVVGVNLRQVNKHVVVGADAGSAHPLTT